MSPLPNDPLGLFAPPKMDDVLEMSAMLAFCFNTGGLVADRRTTSSTYKWRQNEMNEAIERQKRTLKRAQVLQKEYNKVRDRSLEVARAKPWLRNMILPSRVYSTGGDGVVRMSTLHPTKGWQTVRAEVVK